jgi:hypothetical protein
MRLKFLYFIFLLAGVLAILGCNMSDPIVFEDKIDNGCIFRIRTHRDWEMSIPAYFEIECDAQISKCNNITSGIFTFIQPENAQGNISQLVINKEKNIFFVRNANKQNIVLGMFREGDCVAYPPATERNTEYYSQVKDMFSELEQELRIPDLILYR